MHLKNFLEDLALAIVALLILVLPGWIRSSPSGEVRVVSGAVEPLKIDVNTAPWFEWLLLGGIGPARARSIVEYRSAHGPFRSLEELEAVPHLPAGWVEKARPHLHLEPGAEER